MLVLDRLSALMLVLTCVLALAVVLYAIGSGWDGRGWHFHPLLQFQLMGVLGAFLTGDAFNLFVFFEVLLIASYGLMIHSGGKKRLRAGLQYVVYNLVGSTLFLFALGVIYGVTGTLNMADIAVRVAEIPPEDTALLRVGAVLLLLVFAIKAAILPLHFWLPDSYANAPAPVAALFAIMTKVGAYSALRMYTVAFGPDVPSVEGLVGYWLTPAAVLTLVVGMIGILGARSIGRMVAFAAIGSMGTLLIAVSLMTPASISAAVYYLLHSTLATAFMFLVADLVIERRGESLSLSRPMAQAGLIACLFFAAAIALAGMPPLSGFLGKLLVLQAAWETADAVMIWAAILGSSVIAILGFARVGSLLFWKPLDANATPNEPPPHDANSDDDAEAANDGRYAPPSATKGHSNALSFVATFALLAMLIGLTVFADSVMEYADATSQQLFANEDYIDAVLKRSAQ